MVGSQGVRAGFRLGGLLGVQVDLLLVLLTPYRGCLVTGWVEAGVVMWPLAWWSKLVGGCTKLRILCKMLLLIAPSTFLYLLIYIPSFNIVVSSEKKL